MTTTGSNAVKFTATIVILSSLSTVLLLALIAA